MSREAGEPYKDRLLPLPPFLLSSEARLGEGDIRAGLDIDWEYPSDATGAAQFEGLITEVRTKLTALGSRVGPAAMPKGPLPAQAKVRGVQRSARRR